ncbi:MAG: hypothetical protein QMB86_06855 [Polaribacter sp.]
MKKIFYSFAILSLLFTSCNPMEEIYSEIDATETVISGEATYTLTDADYDALGLNYGNFSSSDDAKADLPGFLTDKYPAWGAESLAAVTFKLYAPKVTERSLEVYTVSSDDYADNGHTYGNFSRDYHITDFLDIKYPNAANRLLVSLTYKYYSGSVSTLNNGFLFVNGAWEMAAGITDDEYTAMGEGYSNFSSEDEAIAKVSVFLVDKFKYSGKMAGDIEAIMYKLYTGGSVKSFIANFIYDGASWSEYNNVIDETIKFGHDGTTWVPDNTIKYTLTGADYTLVGNGNYGNFDVRAGKAEEQESVRLDKVNTILLNNFPSDAEGQKYIVTYNIYNGAAGVWSLAVIKEGGAYVKQ